METTDNQQFKSRFFKMKNFHKYLPIFKDGFLTLIKDLEKVKIENTVLALRLERLKGSEKQNKEMKDDIQDIKNKIIEFKEEIKQYIHPPNEPIQNKEEETFNSLKKELEETKTSILPEIKSIKETLEKYKDINIIKEEFKKLENLLLSIQIDTKYLSKGIVKKLEDYISIDKIHSNSINSIIELQDKRIVLCSYDKSITVYSINYEEKKWTQDIKHENAHDDLIYDI